MILTFFSFPSSSAAPQLKKDKLLMELEKLKFLNGPSTVFKDSRFVYLKQCGLYVEEYNVSKVRTVLRLGHKCACVIHVRLITEQRKINKFWH